MEVRAAAPSRPGGQVVGMADTGVHRSAAAVASGVVLILGMLAGCASDAGDGTSEGASDGAQPAPTASVTTPGATSATPTGGPAVTALEMVYVNDISHDANWVVGAEPREPGSEAARVAMATERRRLRR